jgi:hypothetical protein
MVNSHNILSYSNITGHPPVIVYRGTTTRYLTRKPLPGHSERVAAQHDHNKRLSPVEKITPNVGGIRKIPIFDTKSETDIADMKDSFSITLTAQIWAWVNFLTPSTISFGHLENYLNTHTHTHTHTAAV